MAIDLSAVFDLVSHDILLDLLEVQYGVIGKALVWLDSYLHSRHFKVNVNGASSKPVSLVHNMPQGSCLGPVVDLLYASSMEEVIASPEPPAPAPNIPEERLLAAEKIDLHFKLMIIALRKKLSQYVTKKQ